MNIINKIIKSLPFFRNQNSSLNSKYSDSKTFVFKNNYGTIQNIKSNCLLFLMNADETENLFI